jgi:hypothetical protein
MTTSPGFVDVIRRAMESRLMDLHVSLPGKVTRYDAATQLADVQPMLKRQVPKRDGSVLLEELPIVPSVPVVFPRSSAFFLSFPIQPGDFVLLVFVERDHSEFMRTGENADPGDRRMHHLSGAVAIPGFFPGPLALEGAHASQMAMGADGGAQIHITPTDVRLGSEAPADFVALASKVDQAIGKLRDAFNAHTHTGGTVLPAGVTGPPLTVPTVVPVTTLPVGSLKVRAE